MRSPALARPAEWLTGQMPQIRAVIPGISQSGRPSQKRSKPRNSVTWKRAWLLTRVVQLDADLRVPFDPADRVDHNA